MRSESSTRTVHPHKESFYISHSTRTRTRTYEQQRPLCQRIVRQRTRTRNIPQDYWYVYRTKLKIVRTLLVPANRTLTRTTRVPLLYCVRTLSAFKDHTGPRAKQEPRLARIRKRVVASQTMAASE